MEALITSLSPSPGAIEWREQHSGATARVWRGVARRGWRMSRQRKRDAVLSLLQSEDLETVSRSLGGADAEQLAAGVLAAGGASLSTRPASGEALAGVQPKTRLGCRCSSESCWEQRSPQLEARDSGP